MKKFLLAVLVIIVALTGGVTYFLVSSLNSESYKKQIIDTVARLTGRTLEIRGETSIKWRPMPSIEMTQVVLTNQKNSIEPVMAMAQSVLIEIEWASLFKSPLVVKNVEIIRPNILLERLDTDKNEANWHFDFTTPDINLEQSALTAQNSALNTKIEQVRIVEGNLSYINRRTGTFLRLVNIDGDLAIDSLTGPFKFDGKGVFNKVPLTIALNVDPFKVNTPTRFSIQTKEPKSLFDMTLNGTIYPDGQASLMTGDASFSVQKPNVFFESFGAGKNDENAFTKPTVGNFSIDTTQTQNVLKNLTIRFGESENDIALTGSLTQTFNPKEPMDIKGTFALNKMNFKDWKPYLAQPQLWSFINPNLVGTSRISLIADIPSLILYDGNIENVHLDLAYADGVMTINDSTFTLPGGANMNVVGVAEAQNGIPKFQIQLTGQTNDATAILNWLKIMPKNALPDLYQKASIDTRLIITATEFGGAIQSLKVDSSEISGIFAKSFTDNVQSAFVLMLKNVNLDAYLGLEKPQPTKLTQFPKELEKSLANLTFLKNAVSRFDLNFKDLTFKNMPILSGRIMGAIADGTVKIDSMALKDMATANFTLTGKMSGLGKGGDISLENVNFDLNAKQLSLLLERAQIQSDIPLFSQASNARIRGNISGKTGLWTVNTTANLSDTHAKFQGIIQTKEDKVVYQNMNFDIAHPNFPAFVKLLNLNSTSIPNLDGNLKTKGIMNGTIDNFTIQDGLISVGLQKATGMLSLSTAPVKTLTADLQATTVDLERFIPKKKSTQKDDPFHVTPFNDWTINLKLNANQLTYKGLSLYKTVFDADLKNKLLNIHNFSGESRGNTNAPFKVAGTFDWSNTPTLNTTISLTQVPLRADFMLINKLAFGQGTATLDITLNGRGETPDVLLASLNGQGRLELLQNQLIGIDLSQVSQVIENALENKITKSVLTRQVERALTSGKTTITQASGDITVSDGVVRIMDMSIKTPNAVAKTAQLIWNTPLRTAELSMPFKLTAYPEMAALILNLSGDISKLNYTRNTTDLIDMVSGEITRDVTAAAEREQQALQERQKQAQEERRERIRQTIDKANESYRKAQINVINFPSEQAKLLLQSAEDALSVVNQLSIKENLNETQYTQLMEQARLIDVRAKEIQNELEKDVFFDKRRTILEYISQAEIDILKMKDLQFKMPYVEVIPQLIDQAERNLAILKKTNPLLSPTLSSEQANSVLQAAAIAYERIKESYDRAIQFDTLVEATTKEVTDDSVKGNIDR